MAFDTAVALAISLKPEWDTGRQLIDQANSKAWVILLTQNQVYVVPIKK